MTYLRELREKQLECIKQYKKAGYQALKKMPEVQYYSLDDKYADFIMSVVRKINSDESVSIVVELCNNSPKIILPDYVKNAIDDDITIESYASVDGFTITADGVIEDMHPDEYDDD